MSVEACNVFLYVHNVNPLTWLKTELSLLLNTVHDVLTNEDI